MLLVSQNAGNYDIILPNDTIFRINLAWCNTINEFLEKLPNSVNIVPKIESPNAVQNIDEICNALKTDKKIVMLDHDDLFSSIIRNKENKDSFQDYIKKLVDYCQENNIALLRTVGVVFSDDEKRITQYEK